MKKGLILVDIQNDYFKGGKYELKKPEQAAGQANKILTFFRQQGWPVFHVRHISTRPGAAFFIPDTVGADFYKDTRPLEGEKIIIKNKPNSFIDTDLKEKLEENGVGSLVVCGMMTHMCIDTTVRAAADYGYPVILIEDACATRDLVWRGDVILADQIHNAFMASLDGNFAEVMKADEWIRKYEKTGIKK